MADKIKSPADLLAMAGKAKEDIDLRSGGPRRSRSRSTWAPAASPPGLATWWSPSSTEIGDAKLDNVTIHQSGCAGLCEMEPMATVQFADGAVYHYGHLEGRDKVHEIVQSHLVDGKPVTDYLIKSA